MELTLKNGRMVNVDSITERLRTDKDGERKRQIVIDVTDNLTFNELNDLFTTDNISYMKLQANYKKEPMTYSETGIIDINVSTMDYGVSRMITIS